MVSENENYKLVHRIIKNAQEKVLEDRNIIEDPVKEYVKTRNSRKKLRNFVLEATLEEEEKMKMESKGNEEDA